VARPLGNQRQHDEAQFAVIEQAPRLASTPAPVAAAPVIMRVPGIAAVVGSVAEVPAVVVVISVFVVSMVVLSMSVSHVVSFRCYLDISNYEIYLNYIGIGFKWEKRESAIMDISI
jgi:hypothetical protein